MVIFLPPDGLSFKQRLSLYLIRFLSYHNRLDGIMGFVALWWAGWTLMFPHFWNDWPVTHELSRRLWGHPEFASWVLLAAGSLSYVSRWFGLRLLRSICAQAMFCVWGILTLVFVTVEPIFSPGVATYSFFAIAELISYVNTQIGIDQYEFKEGVAHVPK